MPRRSTVIGIGLLVGCAALAREPDWQKKDLVVVTGSEMAIAHVKVCTTKVGNTTKTQQLRVKSTAPLGTVSRDNLVFLHTIMLVETVKSKGDCQAADAVIGTPDIDVAIVIQAEGLQVSTTANGKTERFTQLWSGF